MIALVPGSLAEIASVVVEHERMPCVELRRTHVLVLSDGAGQRAPVELVHPRRLGGAAPRPCASPSPSLQGAARSSRPRSRASRTPKPPVASTCASRNGSRSRTSPAARTSTSVSARGVVAPPHGQRIAGLAAHRLDPEPTRASRARRRAPRRAAPAAPGRRQGIPPGSRPGFGAARSRRSRAASSPPARSPFSKTTGAAPSSRARAAATRPAMPAPATVSSLR